MNWPGQVVHVAAKDVRMLRWFALAYVALVLLWPFRSLGTMGLLLPVLLLLLGLAAVVQAVQADSPVRQEAFWITRPLRPDAVFAAKLLVLAALVAVAALGVALVLARYAVPGGEYPSALVYAVFIQTTLLGTGLALGALTRDLPRFGLAWILGLVAWFMLDELLHGDTPLLPAGSQVPAVVIPALIVLGSLVVAGYQYLAGRRAYALVLLVVFAVGAAALRPAPGGWLGRRPTPPLPAALRLRSLEARAVPRGTASPGASIVVQAEGATAGYSYSFSEMRLDMLAPDGGRRSGTSGARVRIASAQLPVAGATWPTPPVNDRWARLDYRVPAGLEPLILRGRIEAFRSSLIARVPLRVGQSVTRDGFRIGILEVSSGEHGLNIRVQLSAVGAAAHRASSLKWGILDRTRALVLPLPQGSISGGSSGLLVPTQQITMTLTQGEQAGAAPQLTDALELVALDWRSVGGYPVTVPVRPGPAVDTTNPAPPASPQPLLR